MLNAASPKSHVAIPGTPGGIAAGLRNAPVALLEMLAAWQRRSEERANLTKLTEYQLKDLGLSRGDVEEMARKAVWTR